jgi:hypothetical protein
MDDKILKKFFSSGTNLHGLTRGVEGPSSLLLQPGYEAMNKRYTQSSHHLNNNNNKPIYNIPQLNVTNRPDTVEPPEYIFNRSPNLMAQKYMPEQVRLSDNQFNSVNKGNFEVSSNRLAVSYSLILAGSS